VVSAGFVVSAAHLSWTLGASSIVFAALFVAAGGLAHRAGRRNGSLLGLALGTLSSAWCALAEGVVAAAPGVPGDAAAGGVDDAGGQHPDAPGLLGLVAWWPPPVRPAPSSR
jgi:MFS family permease